ncbi:DNA polymerase IV [Sphingomonas sp. BN140010]|uniref:DNA polymerase IV n=1 Tax=Sphingomonas arvum TaxID=2992113 RepID=A0ABT3JFQ1_9SPHN|nr:DNA polymerase IV [Sphingomonas sp. BN140010]MCW3797900.1 DNA polymerase IV [Sphingomonas sp. BN140010]
MNSPSPTRKIIHVDMDAFFASVEQRDNPELRGKPVAVGGGHRGVVAAASYEARKFGVRSALPSVTARRRCPDLVFVKPRFDAYRDVSGQIRAIFADYTDLIEPLSLDEAYLDVTEDRLGLGSAKAIAEDIRRRIRAETQLTASAGVSCCKFVAKLASDQNKPDGLCVIRPHEAARYIASLPVGRFHGIGPKTAERLNALGIHTGADLQQLSLEELTGRFGSSGEWYHRICRGIDERPVRSERQAKSVSAERTFDSDLSDPAALHAELDRVAGLAWQRIERHSVAGRTVTLKVRYADFQLISRACSSPEPIADLRRFSAAGHHLLERLLPVPRGVRLLGLGLSGLCERDEALPLQLGLAI